MWRCKECSESLSGRYELLKHFRLQHRHRQRYPCPHTNCPCTFKTWNALHIHLNRAHPKQNSQEQLELSIFSCHLCTSSDLPTERDYFVHIGTHFKSHETVPCMFVGCSFETNIYATFHSHKNRKHKPHTLKDFKPGVVRTTLVAQESSDNPVEYAHNQDDSAVEVHSACSSSDVDVTQNSSKVIEKNFAASLLKLEHFAHVPGTKIDEFLEELHYLSSATLPLSIDILEGVFQKHSPTTDKSVITEVATALCASNPLLKAIGKGGPLRTSYLRNQYYKDSFNVVEPIEYILDAKEKRSFQYVPVLKSLQQLFQRKDVVDKVVENHRVQQSNRGTGEQQTYKSSQDGSHFKENGFLSGDDLRILLTIYIDDFEICNPLGTSRKKHKLCGIYWTLSNLPPGSHSSLSSIYLAVLCKTDDVKKYGYDRVLHPLLQDMITLEQVGVFIPLLGRCLKGTIQVVAADNLGAHSIAGFNESFSGGYICRFCTATSTDIQTKEVKSGAFSLRTKELHDSHVKSAQENGASCFGVKRHCSITQSLDHFSIHTGYPPDIMHDIFEGLVPVELARCLALLISKKYFNLETLNKSILQFPYKWADKTNRPHVIPHTFSKRKTIGGNAHENWALLRLLPFIIGHLVPEGEIAWQILLDLKDIAELVVAPRQTDESIAYLEGKISEHRQKYQELFPDVRLLPKHHYLEHYPQLIRMFGPLVGLWTMRFEAKHSFF
ncbi:uncharacterized protein LOC117562389 isoform X1 [Gymnodraco acuticeps]|uniref:Uncharacterized protein LOC117562389 isoform X1 n=1 Tax=Gymnodraco acuticeps TaxID=8218 RepID=A0A6P8VY82_GYMAC|nr:uncharacterized protein LOC117562389 isoform X1 [Gymnodraco acuticeps]XP_034096115.1 uncharacterized protein LOC117562389 isoform X1 [Gymnodraco acuticeps]